MPNLPSRTEVVNAAKQLFVMVPLVQLIVFIVMTMVSLVDFSNKSDKNCPMGLLMENVSVLKILKDEMMEP